MDYIKQNIIKEIDNLILEGYQSYSSLPDHHKNDLVALYMDSMGKDVFECISESDDTDIAIHKLRQFIYFGGANKAYDLAETLRNNAEKYLSHSLQELYDERVSVVEADLKRESGLKPYQHKDNGETLWTHV